MSDQSKCMMLQAILNSWLKLPDMSLGQLIVNSIRSSNTDSKPLFYIEDHELESMIINFANKKN